MRAAISGMKFLWPDGRVTINLSPASIPKMGSHYDLAIATAIPAAMGEVPPEAAKKYVCVGELGLAGQVRRVAGILPALLAVQKSGREHVIVPAGQAREAALVPGLQVHRSVRCGTCASYCITGRLTWTQNPNRTGLIKTKDRWTSPMCRVLQSSLITVRDKPSSGGGATRSGLLLHLVPRPDRAPV